MKVRRLISLCLAAGSLMCGAQTPKQFAKINLDQVVPAPAACKAKPQRMVNQRLWIDDEHLAVSLFSYCNGPDKRAYSDLVIAGVDGKTKVSHPGALFGIDRGPSGTLIVQDWDHGRIVIMDSGLETLQTITCELKTKCVAYTAPQGVSNSAFAICYETKPDEACEFYRGMPATKLTGKTVSVHMFNGILPVSPYEPSDLLKSASPDMYFTSAWQISDSEVWSFNHEGLLMRLPSKQAVVSEEWTPKYSNCEAYTSAALSLDGKTISVEHERVIKFYRVD